MVLTYPRRIPLGQQPCTTLQMLRTHTSRRSSRSTTVMKKGGGHDVPKDADYVSCVTHLCSAKGCDINAANEAGETALMLAVGHPELLEVLLRYKPDLSRRNRNSETAPALADRHAFIVSARLLRTHADTANAKT